MLRAFGMRVQYWKSRVQSLSLPHLVGDAQLTCCLLFPEPQEIPQGPGCEDAFVQLGPKRTALTDLAEKNQQHFVGVSHQEGRHGFVYGVIRRQRLPERAPPQSCPVCNSSPATSSWGLS